MAVIAQNGFTVRRIINGKTIAFRLSSNMAATQTHVSGVANGYYPVYSTTTPNIISPSISVEGDTDALSHLSTPTYTFFDQDGNSITPNSTASGAWLKTVVDGKNIKITSNLSTSIKALIVRATATYTQPGTNIKTNVSADYTITNIENSGDSINVAISYPQGQVIDQNHQSVSIKAQLVRGAAVDTSDVNYKWEMLKSGAWTVVSGATTDTLTVTAGMVLNSNNFRCTITDTDKETSKHTPYAVGYATIFDDTDPYEIDVYFPNGDSVDEDTPINVWFKLRQGTVYLDANKTCKIWRYATNGAMDTTWGTNGYKTCTADTTNKRWSTTISWADCRTGSSQGFEVEIS